MNNLSKYTYKEADTDPWCGAENQSGHPPLISRPNQLHEIMPNLFPQIVSAANLSIIQADTFEVPMES